MAKLVPLIINLISVQVISQTLRRLLRETFELRTSPEKDFYF